MIGRLRRSLGEARRVVESMQRARAPMLLVLRLRRAIQLRQKVLGLAQRFGRIGRGCSAVRGSANRAPCFGRQRRSNRTAHRFNGKRDRPPHRLERDDRIGESRGIEAARERLCPLRQKPLDEARKRIDERHEDRDADDVVGRMIGGQQRHAIDHARGSDDQTHADREQRQHNHRGERLEQDVGERQSLGGRARANRGQRRTGRRSNILPDDQRAGLLQPDGASKICPS